MRKIESEPEYVRATLDWCNERRAEKGKKPLNKLPRGRSMQGDSCPCGKATGYHVAKHEYWRTDDPEKKRQGFNPAPVVEFIIAFDNGQLPQYDEEAE